MGERTCSVDGCERKFYGRGYCQLHYQRWHKTGSVEPRARAWKTCSVDDCDRQANVPGSARGWCGLHYGRWQNHGDPLYTRPLVVGVAECSINGCAEVVKARGWCVKHWTRWQRFGNPEARLRGEIVKGRRICPRCSEDKEIAEFGRNRSYCLTCQAEIAAAFRKAHPTPPRASTEAICGCCGTVFLADKRRWRYCSPECSRIRKNPDNWKHYQARKARLRNAHVETFDRREIFERDGWICQLCLLPVDRDVKFPDPRSPSLDHIIPLARGGKHSRANAQTACLGCNVRKGDRLTA